MANALTFVTDQTDSDGDGIPNYSDTPSVHNLTQVTDHFTIQAAIDVAVNGDVIAADPGTYHETIDFNGKSVTLGSTSGNPADTIIDGTGHYHVVQCVLGEGPGTVLQGFTITGGSAFSSFPNDRGGGMFNFGGSSPTVENCVFSSNRATFGGGMFNENSSPTVTKLRLQRK